MKIQILLSSYNGEKYIRDQIESLLLQTQKGVQILVRDDGSTDQTCRILDEYAEKGLLSWYGGSNLGPGCSFWKLLQDCDEADYYAFCDQDDIWDTDKLETAVGMLNDKTTEIPALYFCDVRVVNRNLETLSDHMIRHAVADYPHSLIKNIAPGCTYVFNHAARKIICRLDANRFGIGLYDWTVYQIVSCFGYILFDHNSHMNYRQHDNNTIGAIIDVRKEYLKKIRHFWSGDKKNSREHNARRLEQVYGSYMGPEYLKLTKEFAHYRHVLKYKVHLLIRKDIKMSGMDAVFLKLLIIFNRL